MKTGERGALEDELKRVSKDKVVKIINGQVELMKWVEGEGWSIMNEAKEGDKEREVTFTKGKRERQ